MGSARIMTIVFMDMNIDHSGTAMGALKPVSDMLHMTDTTCLVLMSPPDPRELQGVRQTQGRKGLGGQVAELRCEPGVRGLLALHCV